MSNPGTPPEHFVVFVPGYMGSKLRDRTTGEIVWIDLHSLLLKNPFDIPGTLDALFEKMAYPNENLEPAGIMDQVVFAPPLFKQEHYGRMLAALEKMGYEIDPATPSSDRRAAYTFAYDWRQDNRISARQLGEAIAGWQQRHPGAKAWVIGHSNGGIVARWYIEKEGGKDRVERLFLMGSPWDGAPKAIQVVLKGLDVMFLRVLNIYDAAARSREVIRSFPSFYQLIPSHNPFLRDDNNQDVDPFDGSGWLDETSRRMLADGKRFNEELGTTLSVETYCFFGVKKPTTTAGILRTNALGEWLGIDWDQTEAGDGTVPERSAVHPNAREKLPFSVGHGDIYINPSVLEKLEWELVRKYRLGVLAETETAGLHIMFEPDADIYQPGEPIEVWATVAEAESGVPVSSAVIDVRILCRELLPGIDASQEAEVPPARLAPSEWESGRYGATLEAPAAPGYYALEATVTVLGAGPIMLEELILVDLPMPRAAMIAAEDSDYTHAEPPMDDFESAPPDEAAGDEEGDRSIEDEGDSTVPPGTLSDTEDADTPAEPASGKPRRRYIKAEVVDHEPSAPLDVGETYTLAFGVDLKGQVQLDESRIFHPAEQLVVLKVVLTSKDVHVQTTEPQSLRLPDTGKSKNKVYFDIEPKRTGDAQVTALFYRSNNFIQGVTLTLNVGEPGKTIKAVESMGRPPDGAFVVQPRDFSLFIKKGETGFDLTLVGPVQDSTFLPVTPTELDEMAAGLRKELLDIVYLYKSGDEYQVFPHGVSVPLSVNLLYQTSIRIPEDANREALTRLAKAGWDFYHQLFYAAGDPDSIHMGNTLRKLARETTLKIQIVSQEFTLPWGVLYMAEQFDPHNVDWEMFLGFKHIIEHIPLQESLLSLDSEIPSQPQLKVSLNLNEDIGGGLISGQKEFWQSIERSGAPVSVAIHTTDEAFFDALSSPDTVDQIIYFYGHAASYDLDDAAGPDATCITLTGRKKVTLKDLTLRAPITKPLNGSPLVFINACESAEISPLFYYGLMPYFTAKGARGMIGTECEVPALFAMVWAKRFFSEFLSGSRPLGEVLLSLRREFYQQDNNLLGLIYALYADGDTRVVPGLAVPN